MPNFGPPRHSGPPPPRFGGGFRGPGPGNFMPMGPPPRGMGRPPFPGPLDSFCSNLDVTLLKIFLRT